MSTATKVQRHKWGEHRRTYGSRRSTCQRCGIIRDARFDRGHHWIEYDRPDGTNISRDKAPPCVSPSTPPGGAER